jgi:molybdenum cofactor guanylyltransferase
VDTQREKVSALILAGGLSRRMGRDKAWLTLDGVPLVEHVARRVLPLADELLLSTNSPDRFPPLLRRLPPPAQLVWDENPGLGPLGGIFAGLSAASHDLVLVLAVDMPFVHIGLLHYMARLAGDYQAVVPRVPTEDPTTSLPEPLCAFYRRSCLATIAAHLATGQHQVVSFLPAVRTRWVPPEEIARFDPLFASFRNLNTPEDWEAAVSSLKRP